MANKQAKAFLFSLIILFSLAFPAAITRNYTHGVSGNPTGYISTDLDISPQLTSSSTYCTNATYSPTLSVIPRWYVSTYETALLSTVAFPACLFSETAVNTNQPMNWLTASQYSAFNTHPSPSGHTAPVFTIPEFSAFLSTQSIANPFYSLEKSRYIKTGGALINYSGNFYYKANASMWCNAVAKLFSTNLVYMNNTTYAGSNPALTVKLAQPGTYNFVYSLDLNGCIAGGRTYINNGATCPTNPDQMIFYKNTAFPYTFSSPQKTITVSNPFVCDIAGVISPGNATNGTTFPFTLALTNNGNLPITVTAITLASGSQFSNLVVNAPSLPFSINSGATIPVSGTVKAPATSGSYSLAFFVNAGSSSADCSGSAKNCDATISRQFTVTNNTSSSPISITCSIFNHSSTFTPGEWAYVRASCLQGGSTVNCPALNWTTNITQGSLNPTQTPAGTSPRQSNFSILATAPTPQSGNIGIVCANPATCSATCNVGLTVGPPGPAIDFECYIHNHSNAFSPGEWAWARANCSRAGSPVNCPTLNWATNITGASLIPPQTPPGSNPRQSNFSVSPSSPTPQTGKINVTCQNASACSATCNISNVAIGQGVALSCGIVNHSSIFFPGEWAWVQVNCTQGGLLTTCPALDWSVGLPGASINPNHTNPTSIPPWALSNFSYAGSNYPGLGSIIVTCTNPLLCSTSCLVSVETSLKPQICNMTFDPARIPPIFGANDSSITNVTCYKQTAPATFNQTHCPSFAWATNIPGGQLNPSGTPPALVPQSNFSTYNSPNFTGYVRVNSTMPIVPLSCNLSPITVTQLIGPDYIIANVTPSKPVAIPGETISISVNVKNTGNQPGTVPSITRLGGNCTLQDLPTSALQPGQVASLMFSCTCPQISGLVPYVANVTADATNVIAESNELNNWGIGSFMCMQQALTCQYFI